MKKNAPGFYEYRGFEVFRTESPGYGVSWFMSPVGGKAMPDALDPRSTLRDAKAAIDTFLKGA